MCTTTSSASKEKNISSIASWPSIALARMVRPRSQEDPYQTMSRKSGICSSACSSKLNTRKLRKAAKAALDLNRAGGVKAAGQTRTIISAPDWESWAAVSSGCIVDLVEPPKLLIHPNLTIIPSPAETFHVARMDSSQEASLGTTAAPSPDLDLSSHQFTRHVADPIVARIGEICTTLRDIAADHPEAIPVILKGVRNLSADLGAGDAATLSGRRAGRLLRWGQSFRLSHDFASRHRGGLEFCYGPKILRKGTPSD